MSNKLERNLTAGQSAYTKVCTVCVCVCLFDCWLLAGWRVGRSNVWNGYGKICKEKFSSVYWRHELWPSLEKADIIGWKHWIIMDLIKCYNHLNVELIFIIIKIATYAISWTIILFRFYFLHFEKTAKGMFLGQCYRKFICTNMRALCLKYTHEESSITGKMRNFNIIYKYK